MAYQETKTIGYGTRLSNSIKGIGASFLMLLAGTALLWWNEGRAVKTTKMLEEAQKTALHVEDVSKVDPALNGKLIHATAFTQTNDSLCDGIFGVGAVAIKLDRKVQYYHWVEKSRTETKDKIGGEKEEVTTYSYKKQWVGRPVNSLEFKDTDYQKKNFVLMNVDSESFTAEDVTFGAYQLPESMIRSISGTIPMELNFDEELLIQWNRDIKIAFNDLGIQPERAVAMVSNKEKSVAEEDSMEQVVGAKLDYVHVKGNVLYFGKNPNSPQIGDMSVTFTKVLPGEASVIAEVNGSNLQSFTAKNGETLSVLTMGMLSMDEMFQNEHASNTIMTWVWRFVGLFLVIGGLKGIFGILTTLLKVLPFLADIVGLGVGLVCNVLGFVWSLLVIAIAWLFYRPVIAYILLVAILVLIVFLTRKGREKKKAEAVVI